MAKAPDAFRTISEVAEALDTPPHVLRFWESKFTHVKPVKRAGGRRYYRPDDLALLGGIKILLHDQGMTIKGAQKILREQGVKPVMLLFADHQPGDADDARVIEHAALPDAIPDTDATTQPATSYPVAQSPNVVSLPLRPAPLPARAAPRPDPGPRLLGMAARAVRDGRITPNQIAPLIAQLDDLHRRLVSAR
ncbi:MerR family transcriptional regulator [Loktanella sp. SALINAS62]|uniref:MerR family transcriptional regulator n=1 Tax=Loktanella sp. SALINAS62 TaxID=2706124 RepID=UPI001B8CB626|nr:MerR family transcriptional regulator [Loktanella sp. SALINAS62]MBS1304163.1 MerR family transcriptional regulator [Loktanella sp. SALINAS62]